MSDALLDLLTDADPARSVDLPTNSAGDLDVAARDLLDQIVTTRPIDPRLVARARRERRHRQLSLRSRILVPIAGAAAITALLGIPIALHQDDEATPPATTAPTQRPSPRTSDLPVTPVKYAAAAVRVAEANPRLLVTADGWTVRNLEGFEPDAGEITFQQGPDQWVLEVYDTDGNVTRTIPLPDGQSSADAVAPQDAVSYGTVNRAPSLVVAWYPRSAYPGRYADRASQPVHEDRTVLGQKALLVTYADTDHAVMLPPEGNVFLEMRGQNLSRADFTALLDRGVARVGVRTWLGALPPEIVQAGSADARLRQVLAGVPLPPGFKADKLDPKAAVDSYQFGAKVAGQVVCGWVGAFEKAKAAGDAAGMDAAQHALRGSRDWAFLQAMDDEGDYPEFVWQISDEVSTGQVPEGYRGALGCQ